MLMKTLYDLQRESGKTLAATAEAMKASGVTMAQPGLSRVLARGTQKITVIEALAAAWGLDFATVADAARESRSIGVPNGAARIGRGRPREPMTNSVASA